MIDDNGDVKKRKTEQLDICNRNNAKSAELEKSKILKKMKTHGKVESTAPNANNLNHPPGAMHHPQAIESSGQNDLLKDSIKKAAGQLDDQKVHDMLKQLQKAQAKKRASKEKNV